jgi:hypothetical protein
MACEVGKMKKTALVVPLVLAILMILAGARFTAAQSEGNPDVLAPYTSCHFADGLKIVQIDPLAPGVTSREVDTDSGPRRIDINAGLRIMLAYPDTDFYANVKADLLPAEKYPELKKDLLDNFQHLAHGNTVNTAMRSPLNGLEVHGLDRDKLEGGVLGVYLLFDNDAHLVTIIYLLNQEPQSRKFQTIGEYHTLRDQFLAAYTGCIQANRSAQ